MIVTCQKCATQFHLDDAKVPESGIRVRCSRCKFAFTVESPEQSSIDHGASIAHDTLATGAVGTPDESESDWQFSEDIAGGGGLSANGLDIPAPDAAAAAVDDLLGSVAQVRAPDAEEEPEPENPFDGLNGRDAFGDSGGGDLSGPELDLDEPPAIDGLELDADPTAQAPDGAHDDLSIATEAIGDSAEIGFLDERAGDEPGTFPEGEPAAENPFADGIFDDLDDSMSGTPFAPAVERSTETETTSAVRASGGPNVEAFDVDVETHAANVWIARARAGLGWSLTISLCAAALFVGLVPRTPNASSESVPLSIAGFEAQAVRGNWIDNAAAGPIYVISGSLRAASSVPPAGVELRIRLLDGHGAPIPGESAAVGPPIPEGRLREASPRDLRERQELGARQFMRQKLAPGERRPFHAVFAGVAPAAAAFEFQAVEAVSARAAEEQTTELAEAQAASLTP